MTLPTALQSSTGIRHSSQDAHGTKLIDQYSFGMRSIGCSKQALATQAASDLRLCLRLFFFLFFCFSLRLPPRVHINFPWGNLSPLPVSPSMQRPAVKPEAHAIRSTWRYFAGGGSNLVYDQKVVTASTCYTSRFRFTAWSSSSFLILLLLLLFSSASLVGLHLECT